MNIAGDWSSRLPFPFGRYEQDCRLCLFEDGRGFYLEFSNVLHAIEIFRYVTTKPNTIRFFDNEVFYKEAYDRFIQSPDLIICSNEVNFEIYMAVSPQTTEEISHLKFTQAEFPLGLLAQQGRAKPEFELPVGVRLIQNKA